MSEAGGSVALVHDYLLVMRGAERTFRAISECWPEAPISTLLYDEEGTGGAFAGRDVTTSYLQRLGARQDRFRLLLPLFPRAAERLPIAPASVVVSSSSAFADGIRPPEGAGHVCYCHSPFRYVWHERQRAIGEFPRPLRPLGRRLLERIRRWDEDASRRVDRYIANSELTRRRIGDFYGRESTVIHPPVDVDRFQPSPDHDDYFLLVSELVRHKNVDVALAAAAEAEVPIKVVGDGPEAGALRSAYGGRAEFLGRLGDAELARVYARAKAFVMPAIEEFGIVAVEAHAAGRPVLAAGAGGALEIVVEGETGAFVPPRDIAATAAAMREVEWDGFDPATIRARAEGFATPRFQERLQREVELFGAPA
jgi:glycosyltransferase involved in cell wall biosynthesis